MGMVGLGYQYGTMFLGLGNHRDFCSMCSGVKRDCCLVRWLLEGKSVRITYERCNHAARFCPVPIAKALFRPQTRILGFFAQCFRFRMAGGCLAMQAE